MPTPDRKIIVGVQVHHSANLDDASRLAVNMLTALEVVSVKTGSEEIKQLIEDARQIVRRVGIARTAAGLRLQMHQRDPEFKRYRDGELPWPDELKEGFVPRCTCYDHCLFHDHNQGTIDDCNCNTVCGQHGEEPPAADAA